MTPCRHRVNYYETDKMGITHHANYLHWMEEARVDFLDLSLIHISEPTRPY